MAQELFADNAATTLTSSPSAAGTSFTVASSTGFPSAATGVSQFRVIIGTEIVTVTNVSGTTWTCNALSAGHTSGDAVTHVVTASSLANLGAGGGDYFRTGYYNSGAPLSAGPAGAALTLNTLYATPFLVPVRRAFDRIGINVTTAATAASGGVLRMGIYSPGQGAPGVLFLDAGTISSETTGAKAITISVTLDPGVYWLSTVAQVSACSVRQTTSNVSMPYIAEQTSPFTFQSGNGMSQTSVSGALPAWTSTSSTGIAPVTTLRAA